MNIIADYFCGGGGASTGIQMALGRGPTYAVNHCPHALAMHKANHPDTVHLKEDVFRVNPDEYSKGKPFDMMWFSPDCRHFSKAKGSKPVDRKVRGLAWSAVRAAEQVRPRVIFIENVEEFMTWGPLGEDGRPCPRRKGLTFKQFTGRLRNLGYQVEHRVLCAADYGTPTIRKRFFLIARCDGLPPVWPEPTHRDPSKPVGMFNAHLLPWRSAAECIDWSLPCPSIFERKKPLADSTCRRIAKGVMRYVVNDPEPFIVGIDNKSSGPGANWPSTRPLTTITTENRHALVVAFIEKFYGTASGADARSPMATVTATGQHIALVQASVILKNYTGVVGHKPDRPLGTVTCQDHHSLVQAFLVKYYGCGGGQSLKDPLGTVTTRDRFGLVMVQGVAHKIVDIGLRMLQPRELARAQGFPDDYILTGTKTNQVARIGNSVPPPVVKALVEANVADGVAGGAA